MSEDDVASSETVAARPGAKSSEPAKQVAYSSLIRVDASHYQLLDEIARGGMGRIVRGFDRRLGRGVAIKELLPGNDTTRFEREARITARLVHPSIVGVYEAGTWASGEPFFAMELVAGESLDKRIARCASLADRLALVPAITAAVDALAYAHSEKVIHRDLKPSNVLVGTFGETVVIDWGLAKDLSNPGDDDPAPRITARDDGATIAGSVMGTPAYMPPEQADGSPVDERADVYALGAMLYHVLAGTPPYRGTSSTQILARVLDGKPKPLAELEPGIPADLVAIVEKAMARGRQYRFQNAGEMADELRRFQAGQLVASHRYTFGELVRRWIRRYRAPIAVGVIAAVTLAVVGIVSIRTILAETERADREAADARARADRGTIEHARALLANDPTAAIAALQDLSPNAKDWADARMIVADAEQRGVAQIFHGDETGIYQASMSPDGAMLAGITMNGLIAWDTETGVKARWLSWNGARALQWQGNRAVVFVDDDGVVRRWHPFAGPQTERLLDIGDSRLFGISPDGRWLVKAEQRGIFAEIIDLETKHRESLGGSIYALAWEPDALVYQSNDNRYMRRVLSTGVQSPVPTIPDWGASGTLLSNHGRLYCPNPDRRAHETIVDETGVVIPTGHRAATPLLAALPDGTIATATGRGTGDGKDLGDNDITLIGHGVIARLAGHHGTITSLSTHGDRVISADWRGEVRVWRPRPAVAVEAQPFAVALAFMTRDRHYLVQHEGTATVALYDPVADSTRTLTWSEGEPLMPASNSRLVTYRAAISVMRSTTDRRWSTLDRDGDVLLWDTQGARKICDHECEQKDTPYAISGDGNVLVVANSETGWRYDATTGVTKRFEFASQPYTLALDQTGDVLAFTNYAGRLLDIRFGEPEETRVLFEAPSQLAFTPDGKQLAVVDSMVVRLYDSSWWKPLRVLAGHSGNIYSLSIDEQGRFVTLASDRTARIWPAEGEPIVLDHATGMIDTIDVHGGRALTVDENHVIRLWDLATRTSRVLPSEKAIYAGFTATGEIIAVESTGRLSRYRDATPYGEASLRVWIAAILLAHHSGSSTISQ